MADLTGRQFGRYYTIERLGGDRTGDLFSAYDPTPNREQHVALRVIRRSVARRTGFRKYFGQEMMRSARMYDTALIRVVDFDLEEEQNQYYVAMELLNGDSLGSLLAYLKTKNALRLTDAILIVRQICAAVEFVRLNQGIPRSLDPNTIMIVPSEESEHEQGYQAVLADPGLLRFLEETLESDLSEEVYEMGALLYRLILGQPPAEPVIPPRVLFPELPEQVERVILTALASTDVARHDTYDNTGLMAAALANAAAWTYHFDSAPMGKQTISIDDWIAGRIELPEPVPSDSDEQGQKSESVPYVPPLQVNLGLKPDQKLSVAPGATEKVELNVTNTSREIVHSRILVDGINQEWWNAEPAEFRIGEEGSETSTRTSELYFHPGAGPEATAGSRPLRIRLADTRNGGQTKGETSTALVVEAVRNLQVTAKPPVVESGEPIKITIVNQGNVTETINFGWWDKEDALDFEIEGKAIKQLTTIVAAGGRETIEFTARSKRLHWFGKERTYPFDIDAQNQGGKVPIGNNPQQTAYAIKSRRLLPYWVPIVFILLLFAILFGILWAFRPQIANARACSTDTVIGALAAEEAQPMAGLCWDSLQHVSSLALQPGNTPVSTAITETILIVSDPAVTAVPVRLEARNWTSVIPFFRDSKQIFLPVIVPTPTGTPLPPAPSLSSFCVVATGEQIQQACAPSGSLAYFRGAVEELEITWATENLDGKQLVLSPMAAMISGPEGSMTIPAPAGSVTYTLSIIDAEPAIENARSVTTQLSIPIVVDTVACRVDVPQIYLRESPGQEFIDLAMLDAGTPIILLSAPLNFQKNSDDYRWVEAVVADTNEQGWLAFDEGKDGPEDDWIVCGQDDPLAGIARAEAGSPSTQIGSSLNNGNQSSQNSESSTLSPNTQGSSVTGNEAISSGLAGSGSTNQSASGGLDQLPKTLPTFGPTVTATPTQTPTATGTPTPTATPNPTKEQLSIFVDIEPDNIVEGECVQVEWNIIGVKEVYFDFGRGAFDPIYDNRQRSMELCEGDGKDFGGKGKEEILFQWRIILDDGMERMRVEKLEVE